MTNTRSSSVRGCCWSAGFEAYVVPTDVRRCALRANIWKREQHLTKIFMLRHVLYSESEVILSLARPVLLERCCIFLLLLLLRCCTVFECIP